MVDAQASLAAALAVVDCAWAQWLAEDPRTRAYRVQAAHLPDGVAGYDTAHRLGVIGQVFRTGRAILVPDARADALYDPYDDAVDWELATPVCSAGALVAVLNLEGRRPLPDFTALWERLSAAVRAASGAELPPHAPLPGDGHLADTVWVDVAGGADAPRSTLALARLTAGAGRWTLVFWPSATSQPDEEDDLETAVSGMAERLDVAALRGTTARPPAAWRARLAGRYEYVVSPAPRDPPSRGLR